MTSNNNQDVLRKPFDIEIHKQTFINYLEVIIREDGTVEYAVPSHQEKLIALACEKLKMTRNELNDFCPPAYYFDFTRWLCQVSDCVALWNEHMMGVPNDAQKKTIHTLIEEKLFRGKNQ